MCVWENVDEIEDVEMIVKELGLDVSFLSSFKLVVNENVEDDERARWPKI